MTNLKRAKELEALIATAQEEFDKLYHTKPTKKVHRQMMDLQATMKEYKELYLDASGREYDSKR